MLRTIVAYRKDTIDFSLASLAPNETVAISICSSCHFLTSALGPTCKVMKARHVYL